MCQITVENAQLISRTQKAMSWTAKVTLYNLHCPSSIKILKFLPLLSVAEKKCSLVLNKVKSTEGGQPLVGAFVPKCQESGEFESVQCWGSTGNCWCVDKDGREIVGTSQRGKPDCGGKLN